MPAIDFHSIEKLLAAASAEGRDRLYEHECYRLLGMAGAEAAPIHRLIPVGTRPAAEDLQDMGGVVLKVVSPDIIHKTEARGVRISPRSSAPWPRPSTR